MAAIEQLLARGSDFIWGWPLIILLFGTHLFLTFRLGFPQRHLWTAIKISFSREKEGAGDVSQFGALTTALAATIGTGNIVGVATAVAAGGPGAVLWMWLTGVFGIATKYSEALLSVRFRVKDANGAMCGGPMYVLERGMNAKWLGVIFAALTAVAAFGIGCTVQANSIASLAAGDVRHLAVGQRRADDDPDRRRHPRRHPVDREGLRAPRPLHGGLLHPRLRVPPRRCTAETLPATFRLIFSTAFTGQAAFGGFLGAGMKEAIRFGVARGLFSNESGLGSAPIVAAAAMTKNPVRQALVSSTGTFWDTVVVCAMTGLVVVNSGDWQAGLKGAALTKTAFSHIPHVGPIVLTVGLLTFVFSTILGWSYYGEKAAEYLFGPKVILPYRWLWVVAVMVGSVATLPAVWSFADIANGLMAIPNLVSLLALNGLLGSETRKYLTPGKLGTASPEE